MEKLHAWAGPSGVMKLVLGQECMHQKRVLCNCRMWPPWGLKIVTNPSSIFINKSWSPWTAGQEKEISTRLRVFLWRTSSSTRTTKGAVDKAINQSTHIHPPFSRSWRTMQKVDLLKAWLEMICCRGFFSRIFPWWWFWYLERAWHFFSSLFLLLQVGLASFGILFFPWGGEKNRYLNFQNELSGFQRCCVGALVQKKAWLSGMGKAQWGWWHLPQFCSFEATRGVNEREKVWHVEMGS